MNEDQNRDDDFCMQLIKMYLISISFFACFSTTYLFVVPIHKIFQYLRYFSSSENSTQSFSIQKSIKLLKLAKNFLLKLANYFFAYIHSIFQRSVICKEFIIIFAPILINLSYYIEFHCIYIVLILCTN